MRLIALPLFALGLASASQPEPIPIEPTAEETDSVAPADAGETVCRDRIHEVREANGQPVLDRGPATPDEAYLIAAVDQRIEGCSVMVMRNDTSDIRPLPQPMAAPGVIPAD